MRETTLIADNQKVLAILKSIESFRPFSDEHLQSFLEVGKLCEYDQEETIIQEGDTDTWMYFLLAGEIEIVKNDTQIKILRRSGELFGEMGVVDGAPRSASIRSLTKVLLLGVDGSLIEKKHQKNELAFGYTMFRLFTEILVERLRLTTQENIQLREELDSLKNN